MKRTDLDYTVTMFTWSPKCGRRLRLVGPEIRLSSEAEAQPKIESYEPPGPMITLIGDTNDSTHQLRMSVKWRDGVTGAYDYLTEAQIKGGLRQRIEETINQLGLRCEVFDAEHFRRHAKRLSAWDQAVRYLHPKQDPASWPQAERFAELIEKQGPRSIREAALTCKTDAQTALTVSAYLIYIGRLAFDEAGGSYDMSSRLRPAP